MNRIFVIICLSVVLFSCKSKKSVVTRKPNTTTKEVGTAPPPTPVSTPTSTNTTKVYASNPERYIDIHRKTAQQEMNLYGIPASITLAQGLLESGFGNGRLATEANNHFGIKCHEWTGQKIYHDDDTAQECFRKYKDAKYSFRDHSLFLSERSRYSKLFKLKKEDYKGWAKGLRAAGYATDPKYPQKLISLIERYKLYEFDKAVLGDSYVAYESPASANKTTYIVSKGDTLYSISRRYKISVKELQNLNGLHNSVISIGQELVVKP